MKQILVGQNIPRKCRDSLEKMGYNTVLLPPFSRLQKGVSTHADMLVFKGKNGLLKINSHNTGLAKTIYRRCPSYVECVAVLYLK